jgi:mRNA-degrading endonuclease RelE of RelBE toxin-antitoxin system
MSYLIETTDFFEKSLKKIAKSHRSIKKDVAILGKSLSENPKQGTLIGINTYKIRLAITSKGRGKSDGARIITYVLDEHEIIHLLDIYDKSEKDNISDSRIKTIIESLGSEEE